MKRIATLIVAFLVLAPAGAAAPETAAGKAKLRVMSSSPLKVKGMGFASGERVLVRIRGKAVITRKRATASRSGIWVLSFPGLAHERCSALIVTAVGNRGSRAGMKLPLPLCPPPL